MVKKLINIDETLWTEVKVKAVREKRSINRILEEMIRTNLKMEGKKEDGRKRSSRAPNKNR